MKRIDRYILREIAAPLAISAGIVVALMFLFQARRLATAALGLGLTLDDAAVIFVSALPPFLVLAIPVAYLASVLIALGRMSRDLELFGLSAAGSSPLQIARAPVALGCAIALASIPIAVFGEPYGLAALHERLVDVGMRNLTRAVRPGTFNEDFRGNAVFARSMDAPGNLEDVLLFDERDPERRILVTSRRGRFRSSSEEGILFELEDGEAHLGEPSADDRYDRLSFARAKLELDAGDEIARRTRFVNPLNRMTMGEMASEVLRAGPGSYSRRIEKVYGRRFALPSMAAVFAVLGVAIAISGGPRARARNALLGIGSVVSYYVLTRAGDYAVSASEVPPWLAVWAPNVVMLAIGVVALQRSVRPR